MKILLIDNDVFVEKEDSLCIFKTTGEFAVELKELGHEVELFQTKLKMRSDFHDFNVLGKGLRVTALKRYRVKLITYLNAYVQGMIRVMDNDFVYIYYPTNYGYLALIARLFGKHYGLNVRGQRGVNSRISGILYKYAKVVFTVSPFFTAIASSKGANAYTQKPAISFKHDDIVNDRVYNTKSRYIILYLARLDPAKGINELFEAIHRLNAAGFDFELKIVGDGYDFEAIKLKVAASEIAGRVIFYGAITDPEQIKEIYLASDIFILPSYHEGFPRTIYEAMIFGTPVITTFVGSIPYLMKDHYNCFEIEPKSADSIYNKLVYVMNNYSTVDNITKNATDTVAYIIRPDRPSHAQQLNEVLKNDQ